jgi:dTDP-4-dehydrorhamnose reductase
MLITGASGMLGKALSKSFPEATLLNGKQDLDLTDLEKTEKWFKDKYFKTIIHCAAFTNLSYSEEHINEARTLHADVVHIFNKHCDKLIYISTNPIISDEIYYITKQKGEKNTLNKPNNIVIRTNIYGDGGLVKWVYENLKLNKPIKGYSNSVFNAIHVNQLSQCIKVELMGENIKGIKHIAGDYILSKYDFIKIVGDILNLNNELVERWELVYNQDLVIDTKILDYKFDLCEGINYLKEDFK